MAEEKNLKNFLAIALGRVIRLEREKRRMDYYFMSMLTGLKVPYLQAFEKANAIYHVSKASNLHRAFINVHEKQYTLESFINLLSLISILEIRAKEYADEYAKNAAKKGNQLDLLSKNSAYAKGIEATCLELSERSQTYKVLFAKYFSNKINRITNNAELEDAVISSGIDNDIDKYLVNPSYFAIQHEKDLTDLYSNFFENIPSIFANHYNDIKNSLSYLSGAIQLKDIVSFETTHYNQIEKVTIIGNENINIDDIVKISSFGYLRSFDFEKATIYFLDTDSSPTKLKQQFEDKLLTIVNTHDFITTNRFHLSETQIGTNKIVFSKIAKKGKELVNYILKDNNSRNDEFYNLFILYQMRNALPVAFLIEETTSINNRVKSVSFGDLNNKWYTLNSIKDLT